MPKLDINNWYSVDGTVLWSLQCTDANGHRASADAAPTAQFSKIDATAGTAAVASQAMVEKTHANFGTGTGFYEGSKSLASPFTAGRYAVYVPVTFGGSVVVYTGEFELVPDGLNRGETATAAGTDAASKVLVTPGYKIATASGGVVTIGTVGVAAIWAVLTSGLTTANSIGKKLSDWALGTDSRTLISANAHTAGVTVKAVTDAVTTDSASRTASKADVSALATGTGVTAVGAAVVAALQGEGDETLGTLAQAIAAIEGFGEGDLARLRDVALVLAGKVKFNRATGARTIYNDDGTVRGTQSFAEAGDELAQGKLR